MPSPSHTTEFISLLTSHQTALRGFIISLLPGCPDVCDVLQETNIVLWEKKNSYTLGSDFKAWAFTIARNKVMKYWDKQKKQQKTTLSAELMSAIHEAKLQQAPTQLEHQLTALQSCLQSLKPDEQQLISARYSSHNDLKSLSHTWNRPTGSLRVTLCRIREKLRTCIELRLKGGLA
ncbi:sigma-70 family RNA polymerase sigma factor [Rubritalea tangerina]|uniref:Sigma-70 family RNA polymerase sigma factor n=1 Tax=Rubritalea tangerina TaxID=430798 RepID=A0ABW4ZFH4_9BACT